MAVTAKLMHPALALVCRMERMWEDDNQVAYNRAEVIVRALIASRLLKGAFVTVIPDDGCAEDVRQAFFYNAPDESGAPVAVVENETTISQSGVSGYSQKPVAIAAET